MTKEVISRAESYDGIRAGMVRLENGKKWAAPFSNQILPCMRIVLSARGVNRRRNLLTNTCQIVLFDTIRPPGRLCDTISVSIPILLFNA